MELMEHLNLDRKEKAKVRLDQLKGFNMHLVIYLIVGILATASKVIRNVANGESFNEIFWDVNTYLIWIFWGIGVGYHAFKVFRYTIFFTKDWEERKIREFMEEEQQNRWN